MPRKEQGWITFQSSEEERLILEQYCQESQRTKTEILRELVRTLKQSSPTPITPPISQEGYPDSVDSDDEFFGQKSEYKAMKVSARNVLKGTVKRIVRGAVNTEVTLEIALGVELISIITRSSAEELRLSEGKEAYAVIKSNHVMLGVE